MCEARQTYPWLAYVVSVATGRDRLLLLGRSSPQSER